MKMGKTVLLLAMIACKPTGDSMSSVEAADSAGTKTEVRPAQDLFSRYLSISRLGRELSINVAASVTSRLVIESVLEAGYNGVNGENSNLGTQIFKSDSGFRASFTPNALDGAMARAWIAFNGERTLCTISIATASASVSDTCDLSKEFYCKNRESLSIQKRALFDCESGATRNGMTQEQQRMLDEKITICKQIVDQRLRSNPAAPAELRADGCVCGRTVLNFYEGDVAWFKSSCERNFDVAERHFIKNRVLCSANVPSGKTELREQACVCKATGKEFDLFASTSISRECGLDGASPPTQIADTQPSQKIRDYREFVAICQELGPNLQAAGIIISEDCICGDTQFSYERDFVGKELSSADFRRLCVARYDYMNSVKPICAEIGGEIEEVMNISWQCRCGAESVGTEGLTTKDQFRAACQRSIDAAHSKAGGSVEDPLQPASVTQ